MAKLSSIDISKLPRDRASYGSTVVLRDIDRDSEITYRLVTPEEIRARWSEVTRGS